MNDTPPTSQAEISLALEALFRDVIRAATSPITPPEMMVLVWVREIQILSDALDHLEAGVNLGAAFMSARDTENFDRTLAYLVQTDDWKNQPRYRDRIPNT